MRGGLPGVVVCGPTVIAPPRGPFPPATGRWGATARGRNKAKHSAGRLQRLVARAALHHGPLWAGVRAAATVPATSCGRAEPLMAASMPRAQRRCPASAGPPGMRWCSQSRPARCECAAVAEPGARWRQSHGAKRPGQARPGQATFERAGRARAGRSRSRQAPQRRRRGPGPAGARPRACAGPAQRDGLVLATSRAQQRPDSRRDNSTAGVLTQVKLTGAGSGKPKVAMRTSSLRETSSRWLRRASRVLLATPACGRTRVS